MVEIRITLDSETLRRVLEYGKDPETAIKTIIKNYLDDRHNSRLSLILMEEFCYVIEKYGSVPVSPHLLNLLPPSIKTKIIQINGEYYYVDNTCKKGTKSEDMKDFKQWQRDIFYGLIEARKKQIERLRRALIES